MADMEFKQVMEPAAFAQALRAAADAVERGESMQLTLQGQSLTLQPQGRLEVEYEREKGKNELQFEIKWYE